MSDSVRDHEAHFKIDTHEKVCAERYGNLWESLKRVERDMAADRAARAASDATAHARFNVISNRMWLFLAAICTVSTGAVSVMAWELLKAKGLR